MRLLIRGADAVLTSHPAADSVLVEDGVITAIGTGLVVDAGTGIVDARGAVVVPGLVNTHHHMFQCLTRVRGQEHGLFGWLGELWPLFGRHDSAWQEAATAVAAGELLLSGCTTTVDHHYLPPASGSPDPVDAQVTAGRRLGIRLVSAVGSMDVDDAHGGLAPAALCESTDRYLRRLADLTDRHHDQGPAWRTRIAAAPCHPLAVTSTLARAAHGFARDRELGFHTHLAEARDEEAATVSATGLRPVELLAEWGVLGPRTWLAHCVHLSDGDIEVLADTGTAISLCPTSNLRLGSGISRIRDLVDAGITVSLGVDGSASNDGGSALAEARQLLLVSRVHGVEHGLTASEALVVATTGGARALGLPELGRIEVGARADLAVFDVSGLNAVGTEADPVAGLLLSPPATARHVLVEGELVVRDHALVNADPAELAARAREVARSLQTG
ncbi:MULTISPECIES: amidohydrolase family protein [unclassified Nocardioides]|uniref:amidohydrolase family protein n=1 Tax=unclassified Nocardioides TaxID=2615069 RepID=UPI000056F281|nr:MULTISPECIES: amidohydrolase family protein [unclassified Nocardioides]ABL80203.1 amidohydrolase [Nocardioides sp. JS614]